MNHVGPDLQTPNGFNWPHGCRPEIMLKLDKEIDAQPRKEHSMDFQLLVDRYMACLLQSDRTGCRTILGEALQTGTPANVIYTELFWPVMAELDILYREHRIDDITINIATRINRTLVDQLQSKLPKKLARSKKMIITCADAEPEELGAQMCADLFESDGWEIKFLGGKIPMDETVEFVNREQPEILFIYGTKPSGAPGVRKLMDTLRNIGACPNTRIMLSGGVFNRAEGLWEEIGADLFAPTAKEAISVALSDNKVEPETTKKRRKPSRRIIFETNPELQIQDA